MLATDSHPPSMHHTLFDTPVVNTLLRALSMVFLKLSGWKVEASYPPMVRSVC